MVIVCDNFLVDCYEVDGGFSRRWNERRRRSKENFCFIYVKALCSLAFDVIGLLDIMM